jgi:HNH endonuclease
MEMTPPSPNESTANKSFYVEGRSNPVNFCPSCGGLKKFKAKLCRECRFESVRSPINFDLIQVDSEPCRLLPLTKGLYAIVDAGRYDFLMQWRWYAQHGKGKREIYYANRKGPRREDKTREVFSLHRAVFGDDSAPEVDHINRNPLDCRRSNLRAATRRQNSVNRSLGANNTSGYKRVYYNEKCPLRPYTAYVRMDGKCIYLGNFKTAEEAARAHDKKASEVYGEFAYLNFPQDHGKER